MRVLRLIVLLMIALSVGACEQNNENQIETYHVQVNAQIGEEARTTIIDDAEARQAVVTWAEDDQIGVVAVSSRAISTLDLASGAGSRVATFDGEVVTTNALDDSYLAFYPNQDEATATDGVLRLRLPSEQRNVANGIDGATCGFMVTRASGAVDALSLGFENLFAVVKLSLAGKGEQLARVEFSGGAGESVSGDFTVDLAGEECDVEFDANAAMRTYLLNNQALTSEPTTSYIVVPAITYEKGYSVRVTVADGRTMAHTVGRNGGRELQRGVIYNLPTLNFTGEATDLSLAGRANCYVVSEAGRYCFDSGLRGGATAEMV